MTRPKPTPNRPLIYLSWSGCSVFIRRAHKHWRCHINQTSVCNCPPNGMRSYRFMEVSGRLIPDWDNRVLMTPFIVGFFFVLFFCIFTPVFNYRTYWCRNRLLVQLPILPVGQVKKKLVPRHQGCFKLKRVNFLLGKTNRLKFKATLSSLRVTDPSSSGDISQH